MIVEVDKIKTESAPELLELFTDYSEVQLYRFYEPQPGLFIAETPNVIERALCAGHEPIAVLTEPKYVENGAIGRLFKGLTDSKDLPIYVAPLDEMVKLTGYELTRGLLCVMRRTALLPIQSLLENTRRLAILENVMNPTNVGAIFRSAAALGIDAILLTSGCADPLYRRAARVAMGTPFQIPWTYIPKKNAWPDQTMEQLKKAGFITCAMALKDDSVSINHPGLVSAHKLAIILGTEGDGLADTTIEGCDYTVKIPMAHGVDSLNVAAASAVAFWQLCN